MPLTIRVVIGCVFAQYAIRQAWGRRMSVPFMFAAFIWWMGAYKHATGASW